MVASMSYFEHGAYPEHRSGTARLDKDSSTFTNRLSTGDL